MSFYISFFLIVALIIQSIYYLTIKDYNKTSRERSVVNVNKVKSKYTLTKPLNREDYEKIDGLNSYERVKTIHN